MSPKPKPDVVEQAFIDAPTGEDRETEAQRAMVDTARANYESTGVTLDADQVSALLRAREP